MFLGFAQFGKQLENSRKNFQKQDRKSDDKLMKKTIKKTCFFHQFSWLFQVWKMHGFFYVFFMENGLQNGAKIDAKIV